MAFDFETRIDRRGTGAVKWDRNVATHGQAAPGEAFAGDGPEPIPLTIADMEITAPPVVVEAMRARLAHGVFGYTMPTPAYRAAACAWQERRHGWRIEEDWILPFHGVILLGTLSDPDLVAEAIRRVVAPTMRLTGEQQRAMAPHAAIERYGAGELIQATGTVPEHMSFIMSGTVLLAVDAEDGSRTEAGRLEEGSYLGQTTLVRHSAIGSAYALDEVTLVTVQRDAIERVVQRNPLLLQEFGRSIDERRAKVLRALNAGETDSTAAAAG